MKTIYRFDTTLGYSDAPTLEAATAARQAMIDFAAEVAARPTTEKRWVPRTVVDADGNRKRVLTEIEIALPAPPPAPTPTSEPYAVEVDDSAEVAAARAEAARTVTEQVQKMLDDKAREWGYDDIRSAVTYLDDPDTTFAAEAAALRDWRSAVWAYLRDNAATATDAATLLAGLPAAPARP